MCLCTHFLWCCSTTAAELSLPRQPGITDWSVCNGLNLWVLNPEEYTFVNLSNILLTTIYRTKSRYICWVDSQLLILTKYRSFFLYFPPFTFKEQPFLQVSSQREIKKLHHLFWLTFCCQFHYLINHKIHLISIIALSN